MSPKPTTPRDIPPIHPGEILKDEFLDEYGLSQYELAKRIGVPAPRVNAIVLGKRRISADSALRLGRFFGTSPEFWLNLQNHYDLTLAKDAAGEEIERGIPLSAAQVNLRGDDAEGAR